MKSPFKRRKSKIPISQQKQLRFPKGKQGEETGKHLYDGNSGVIDQTIAMIEFKKDLIIGDIGCGPGYSLKMLDEKLSSGLIVGVDPSEVMCKQARENNIESVNKGRIIIVNQSTPNLDFPDNYFDILLLTNVFYFWDNPTIHLKELSRVLKPSGKLIIYMTDRESLLSFLNPEDDIFNYYYEQEVLTYLERSGFLVDVNKKVTRKISQTGNIFVAIKK